MPQFWTNLFAMKWFSLMIEGAESGQKMYKHKQGSIKEFMHCSLDVIVLMEATPRALK